VLAAGGYAAAVQLWDVRVSSKRPTMSLPLKRDEIITSLLCCTTLHRIVAGASSGSVTSWDLRNLAQSNVAVFGARGPAQAAPLNSRHLPTIAAAWPTPLPYRAQLSFCTATLAGVGEFPVPAALPPAGFPDGRAAVKVALARSATLATSAAGSKVNHLVADPSDPRRVAFSLACGSAGAHSVCSLCHLACGQFAPCRAGA
jgi:hypothetical protein